MPDNVDVYYWSDIEFGNKDAVATNFEITENKMIIVEKGNIYLITATYEGNEINYIFYINRINEETPATE